MLDSLGKDQCAEAGVDIMLLLSSAIVGWTACKIYNVQLQELPVRSNSDTDHHKMKTGQ
ncbi:MAG: hypothetical protein OXE78_09520 [Gammaproteobacteria bacterium]|nr:hypothetical protein [Gammaproteobacteria bacterium]